MLKPRLKRPERRLKIHCPPPQCPHLNPIEQLWDVKHRHAAHSRHYKAFQKFAAAIFEFFDKTLTNGSKSKVGTTADNFHVVSCDDHLVVG